MIVGCSEPLFRFFEVGVMGGKGQDQFLVPLFHHIPLAPGFQGMFQAQDFLFKH